MTSEGAGDPARGQRTHLSTRAKARLRAVDLVFEADLREEDPLRILATHDLAADHPVREYTRTLVRAVVNDAGDIDGLIKASLGDGWTLERMPRVDRSIARVAVAELRAGEVPVNVVIAEATQLATELSTDSSPGFVNALLARIAAKLPPR